jgi:hypothetical protein
VCSSDLDLRGAAYIPFIGEGDLALEVPYAGRWPIFGADIDDARVATAIERLAGYDATLVVADCDGWPFAGRWPLDAAGGLARFCIADFDAYAYPYNSWRAFVQRDQLADTVAVFFTDGQRGTIQRNGVWRDPDGTHREAYLNGKKLKPDTRITRPVHARWWKATLRPWWEAECERIGYTPIVTRMYPRRHMTYWCSIIEKDR